MFEENKDRRGVANCGLNLELARMIERFAFVDVFVHDPRASTVDTTNL